MKTIPIETVLCKLFILALLIGSATAQTAISFEVVDGKSNRSVLQLSGQKSASSDGISVQQDYHAAQGTRPESWDFVIKNNSSSQRWLYLNWEVLWDSKDNEDLRYWSGKGEPISGIALLQEPSADVSLNTSMIQAIYDDRKGMALALPPDEIVSQFEQSLQSGAGNSLRLRLQIPLVLDAGQSDTFPVELYRFTPRYGFLDALQKYYAAHPIAFSARTNIDPRAAGVIGARPYHEVIAGQQVQAFEKRRRFGGDWDWVYAQFRRTGDIYTRDHFWDYEPARQFNSHRSVASAQIFRETRHRNLEKLDAAGGATAFYVPSFLYAEEKLAQEQYSDAIIRKPDGTFWRHYTTPWVTYSDNEILMYPWGNKFAEQSMKDARQLVEENNIPAFGYDIMAGGARFRGKGMKESPRRAFDKDGEYVDSAVAIAKMADFTRSLENNGRKVGLVGNATNDTRPFLVTRSDTLMFEQAPYRYAEELIALRYAAGHKVMSFWSAWRLTELIDWEKMSASELREAYIAAADYARLTAYRYGGYPGATWPNGVPQIARMLPQLKEIILKGWQAVPAVRGAQGELPGTLWPARYGEDLGSYITVGNAEKEAWSGQLIVDNDYLGASNYLFVDLAGKPVKQTVQERTTVLEVQIPPRETLVLRAVALIPASASGTATVGWKDDGSKGDLNIQSTLGVTKVLAPRDGWQQSEQNKQSWSFRSDYFASPTEEIREFPFFSGKEGAQIILPENPTADELWSAERIREYFVFWGQEGMKPSQEIDLPIIRTSQNVAATDKPQVLIGGNAKTVRREGNTLVVDGASLREATVQLLAALDEKYLYVGVLPSTGRKGEGEALEKAGLAGKMLGEVTPIQN